MLFSAVACCQAYDWCILPFTLHATFAMQTWQRMVLQLIPRAFWLVPDVAKEAGSTLFLERTVAETGRCTAARSLVPSNTALRPPLETVRPF